MQYLVMALIVSNLAAMLGWAVFQVVGDVKECGWSEGIN